MYFEPKLMHTWAQTAFFMLESRHFWGVQFLITKNEGEPVGMAGGDARCIASICKSLGASS
jgi:hypothetical protein